MTAEARVVAPGVTVIGNAATGTGDATSRPIPTEEHETADIFDRLEQGRARRAIRSPIVLQGPSPEPTAKTTAARAADAQRFAAPAPRVEEEPSTAHTATAPPAPAPNAGAAAATATSSRTTPVAASSSPTTKPARADMPPCPVPRCGDVLTGGGAPRGWILVRVVGSGAPRRYHSPACVTLALHPPAARPDHFTNADPPPPAPAARRTPPPPAPPQWGPVRRGGSRPTVNDAEIARRYQAGATPPQIAQALGHMPATIRRSLDRSGIERRDDRHGHSGSEPKEYDPQLVARVRRLYTLHELTQDEVAHAIGISTKVVQNIMARHGIQARPPANVAGHGHGTRRARREQTATPAPAPAREPGKRAPAVGRIHADQQWRNTLAALGKDTSDVRAWCREHGVTLPVMGPIPRAAREAFTAAHTTQEETA